MFRRRHPKKSRRELFRKYWTVERGRHIFTVRKKTEKGPRVYQVLRLSALPSGRYIKIPKAANPYLPEFARWSGDSCCLRPEGGLSGYHYCISSIGG